MIGRKLGGRYEILERVGGGGMALVYRARDTFLNRTVAVKLLRSQYAEDEEFLGRFRREAQSAARLSHPNVVNVYDVGQEGACHYIVMEFVEGSSLKEMVRERGPLSIKLATRIAYQICQALDHAHRNKVVHRDIKPHNILVMPSGSAKVTDFGIARAVTDTTLTNTGNIIGSVHYFSPEQARGGFTGDKSDLYSLGVVLYEMLTGTVPFKGDSPFSVAIKHLQAEVTPPSKLRRDIPADLEKVVMKALEKDSLKRYRSATEMVQDLGRALKAMGGEEEEEPVLRVNTNTADDKGERMPPKKPMKPKGLLKYVIVGLALMLIGAVAYGVKSLQEWVNVPLVEVPNVVGLHLTDAEVLLRQEGLSSAVVAERTDEEAEEGFVLSQDPESGGTVKQGREIKLVVSLGPESIAVPDLLYKPFREADVLLKSRGLDFGNLTYEFSEDYDEGIVLAQSPGPSVRVSRDALVDLVVSKGSEPTETLMPNLVGLRYEEALEVMRDTRLEIGTVTEEPSSIYPEGFVTSQIPSVGSLIMEGHEVSLKVSSGGASPSQRDVIIALPNGESDTTIDVRIDLVDVTGERTVYNHRHKSGDILRLSFQWYGPEARLKIYLDGRFHRESILRS